MQKRFVNVTTGVWASRTFHRHTSICQRLNTTVVVSPTTALQNVEVNPRAIYKGDLVVTELGSRVRNSKKRYQALNETHNFGGETGVVGKVNNCVVEVEQICLVVGLEFMEEIEDLEGEDGVRSNQRGREPSPPEQLSTAVVGLLRITHTVSNNNLMDTAEIENRELVAPGWVWTNLASPVTKLRHEAEGSERFGGKVLTIPSLQGAGMSDRSIITR